MACYNQRNPVNNSWISDQKQNGYKESTEYFREETRKF